MNKPVPPIIVPLYIIALIVAIPQLSETIYAPSLPNLAKDLLITANLAEYTLTIYLFGFVTGVFIWGNLSDFYGFKPCLLVGLLIYTISCLICYLTHNISILLIARFIQAFGSSVGSVLGQAIAGDAIKLEDRGKVFSTVSIAMSFAPAIGPIIGSLVIKFYHWSFVFLVLITVAIFTIILILIQLPETNQNSGTKRLIILSYTECFNKMTKDLRLWRFAFLVGAVNGILFGYFAEAPFYFINGLNISTPFFGIIIFSYVIPLALGGMVSKRMHKLKKSPDNIIFIAINIMCLGSLLFFLSSYFNFIKADNLTSSLQTLLYICMVVTGIAMVIPNCLGQALENYSNFTGTAASLFGFIYYLITAGSTALIGYIHDGYLIQLPLFILMMSMSMMIVFFFTINTSKQVRNA